MAYFVRAFVRMRVRVFHVAASGVDPQVPSFL